MAIKAAEIMLVWALIGWPAVGHAYDIVCGEEKRLPRVKAAVVGQYVEAEFGWSRRPWQIRWSDLYLESGEVLNLTLIKVGTRGNLYRSQPLGRLTPSVYKLDIRAIGEDINGLSVAASYQCSYPSVSPTVSLSAAPNPVDEGDSVTVTARLSSSLSSNVTIPLTLTARTAEEEDYGTLGSLTIDAGSTSGTGTVTTSQDDDTDDETFTVALDTANLPWSVTAGSPSSVRVTITDNDMAITYTLSGPEDMNLVEGMSYTLTATASSAVKADTTVTLTRDAAASSASPDDYNVDNITIAAGETEGTTLLTVTDDELPDGGMGTNVGEKLVLFGSVDGVEIGDLEFTLWDTAVPALPAMAQLLLAALLAAGGWRRHLRRQRSRAGPGAP